MSPTIRPRTVVDEEYKEQTAYTIDLDLPTAGILSTLYLIVKARTETTEGHNSPFMKYLISSISVNEGGAAFLNAARPTHFQADYYYKTGKFPHLGYRRWETVGDVEEVIPILFGEKENDLEHTIDLSKLSDPKLSVTYDLATKEMGLYDTWDSEYYPRFSVIANLIEGPGIPESKGYHSLRQVETYNPANDEIHLHELKGTRPIKRIYFHPDSDQPSYSMRQSVDKIRLHGDNEAWVPLSMTGERFKNYVKMLYGSCRVECQIQYLRATWSADSIVEEYDYRGYDPFGSLTHLCLPYGGSGRGHLVRWVQISSGDPADAEIGWAFYKTAGIAPWSVYPIDMEKMLGLEYLDPQEHKPVYLELEHPSNATTTCIGPMRIVVQDLVKQ